jgi:spore photoproduct lyase
MEPIDNHNNIEALRTRQKRGFPRLKRVLVIGTRKNHKYVDNHKVSDFLVPYIPRLHAMCLYCYLVCHYNKCAYLPCSSTGRRCSPHDRKAESYPEEKVFEIGSNSDLVLENPSPIIWSGHPAL